ncbi:MAG: hypothetical protein WKF58_16950 [Ilumatobacteraceae bacterium]
MPHASALDLRPALAQYLLAVCVLPQIGDATGEATFARQQRRRLGDRSPAVILVLGVEREVHAEVVAVVHPGGVVRPWCGHHQRGAGGDSVAQRGVDADVGGVAGAQIVARDDDQLGVRRTAQPFGERAGRWRET